MLKLLVKKDIRLPWIDVYETLRQVHQPLNADGQKLSSKVTERNRT